MFLLPRIEVKGGESVHVLQLPSQGEARPLMDPVEVVTRFARWGAQGFHVIDVDGATDPGHHDDHALAAILDNTVLPVVAGGGVRSLKRVQELLDARVRRVLVGSMGVLHQDWLKEAAICFPEQLVASVDTHGDDLVIHGRTEKAAPELGSFLRTIDAFGLESIHLSYLGQNGAGVALMERLAHDLKTPLTYTGPVTSADDLRRLDAAGVRGVALGEEIYDGRLSFEALAKEYRVR